MTVAMTDFGKWELSLISKMMSAKFHCPSECLAVDEVIVLFKGRITFKQYIPK